MLMYLMFYRCILKDFVHVEDDTVVPSDMVIPPFSLLRGCPAKIISEVAESYATIAELEAKEKYIMFITKWQIDVVVWFIMSVLS